MHYRINIENKTSYYASINSKSSFKINASQIIPALIYYLAANRCILLINPCNQVSTKRFYQLYRETYNSLIIHDATLSSQRRVIFIKRASYVVASIMSNVSLLRLHIRMKSWLRTYPNDDRRNMFVYVCECEYVRTKRERFAEMCHNPARLRFFSLFSQCPSRSANLGATLTALNLVLPVAILYRYLNHRCSSL